MTLNILLIEDNPADSRLIQREITAAGIEADFLQVQSLGALTKALPEREWHLVLSDFSVPGMDYRETFSSIHRHDPNLPVILVSGSVGEERAVDLLKLGTWNFVLKDNLARLVPAIEQSLREARERSSRQVAEAALRESEALVRGLGDNLPNGAIFQFVRDTEGNESFTYVSRGFERLTGVSVEEALSDAQTLISRVHPDDEASLRSAFQISRKNGEMLDVEIRLLHREGWLHWVYLRGSQRMLADGGMAWDGVVVDVSQRKRIEEQQRIAASVFNAIQEGIIIADPHHVIIDVNPSFTQITGYKWGEVIGRHASMLGSGHDSRDVETTMMKSLNTTGHWRGELWARRKSGEIYPQLLSITAVKGERDEVDFHVGVFTDISPFKAHEIELHRIAHYDSLTGMPNRRLLADRMAQAIAHAKRTGKTLGICYMDLDGFKQINDRLGHDAGDQFLVAMTRALQDVLRADDTLARLGGDEFVLLLNELHRDDECLQVLQRVLAIAARPIEIDRSPVSVTASIGVTLFPRDDADADTLLRHADQAMYRAKEAGKNCYHVYDLEHDREVAARRDVLLRLNEALCAGEFILYYQPKVDLVEHRVIGAEALIRWQHPEHGLLSPGAFLHFFEDSELNVALGEWVIDRVLQQISEWKKAGLRLRVSANVSAGHLLHPLFVERLKHALTRYPDTAEGDLELEILESAAIDDLEAASRTLDECRALGVLFALDDFGTGYSSLTYLRKLPVDTLKIDQTFVRDMLEDPEDIAIVESVIRLAQTFGRVAIAEGVETRDHASRLLQLGCRLVQGYGIAHPMPATELPNWVRLWRTNTNWLSVGEFSI